MPITALAKGSRKYAEVVGRYPALTPGNLFETPDLLTLPLFDGGDELSGVEKGVEGSGIEPGKAPSEQLHLEGRTLQIQTVEIRNLQLAARGRLHGFGELDHAGVVEIQTRYSIVRLRMRWFFLNRKHIAGLIELGNAIKRITLSGLLERGFDYERVRVSTS